jgi:recombination protein RecR
MGQHMNDQIINKLTALFEKLPGIGPRQARRFVYAVLDQNNDFAGELSAALLEFRAGMKRCPECFRACESAGLRCVSCEAGRDAKELLVVERDVDLENIEKLGVFRGQTLILGGTIQLLGGDAKNLRLRELFEKIRRSPAIKEVILATSATNEGDATAAYITKILEDFVKADRIKITRLGRGLSTGASLEYSDRSTFEHALKNRG